MDWIIIKNFWFGATFKQALYKRRLQMADKSPKRCSIKQNEELMHAVMWTKLIMLHGRRQKKLYGRKKKTAWFHLNEILRNATPSAGLESRLVTVRVGWREDVVRQLLVCRPLPLRLDFVLLELKCASI